jgi:proteasome accessory factor B
MDEVEVEVRLRFSPAVAPRVKESVWHHSQRIEDADDGGCELTMRVGGIREVRAWVLGWGADVEVLAPTALRDEVHAHAAHMLEIYQAGSLQSERKGAP